MNSRNKTIKKIYSENTINKINKKIKLLGSNCNYNSIKILNTRLTISILLFSLIMIISSYGYILSPIITITYWFLDEYIMLDLKLKKRIALLDEEAIMFFEVLFLSLEGGKNINDALKATTDSIDNELSLEFKKCLEEANMGKSFEKALKDTKSRIPSDTINNIIISITESSYYGNNISDVLKEQVDYLREKRILYVKTKINKLPIKISVISVLFFIPIILLIILGPILINIFL